MKEFISHYTAAYHWKIKCLDEVFGELYVQNRRTDDPVHITVTDSKKRYKKNGYNIHLCKLALPSGAVRNDKGKNIASPELVFLQLANYLDMNRLIFFGLQMCSHPPGEKSKAITTKRKLGVFLQKMSGHNGYLKATRALKYVEDGSNSVMESLVYMILTLPHSYGGYSLGGISLNHEIISESNNGSRSWQKRYYVDLFYKDKKLAVEYDSRSHHSEKSKQEKDSIRATSLNLLGVDVISLKTLQLYNKKACDEFAYMLAARLGRRMRIRAKDFEKQQRDLRKMLPPKPKYEE